MPEFVRVGKSHEFKPGQIHEFEIDGDAVAVANCAGTVRAFAARCTHLDVDLVDGFISGGHVFCPLHDSCFDLDNGILISGPAANPLRIYAVRVDGEDVFVGVG